MAYQTVVSTVIAAVDYDDAKQALTILFFSGKSYTYEDIPQTIYDNLLSAPSVGSYYNANIKNNFFYTGPH